MAYEALYTRGRPKNFSQLVGQEHISIALTNAINSDRLSHAYLLVGTRGTGKTSTARLLAKAMNCDTVFEARNSKKILPSKEIPCNNCNSCKSIGSSPDNVEFDAASNRSVEDVTRLLSTAHLAPLQSRIKTFIIDEVHMLSFEAVNSILKLIEEPPPNVAFFLATTELQKVPMTIRSRCQVLNFRLIPQDIIAAHLKKFADRLKIELDDNAASRIARLAEGSMRDALTYLDQCYSMADKKISLDDVNKTLGLISDSDLDEIISAVQNKNRAEVGRTLNHAFKSGLTSISIAESLITRLRDLEFSILGSDKEFELQLLENFADELRKTILEMQGSGVPDIILEMALMKFSAPKIIFTQPTQVQTVEIPQTSAPTISPKTDQPPEKILDNKSEKNFNDKLDENLDKKVEDTLDHTSDDKLDEVRNFFYDMLDDEFQAVDHVAYSAIRGATLEYFSDNEVVVSYRNVIYAGHFKQNYKKIFEEFLFEKFKRNITVTAIIEDEPFEKSGKIIDVATLKGEISGRVENSTNDDELKKASETFDALKVEKIINEE